MCRVGGSVRTLVLYTGNDITYDAYRYTKARSNPCTKNFDAKIDFECTRGEQLAKVRE